MGKTNVCTEILEIGVIGLAMGRILLLQGKSKKIEKTWDGHLPLVLTLIAGIGPVNMSAISASLGATIFEEWFSRGPHLQAIINTLFKKGEAPWSAGGTLLHSQEFTNTKQ
ncbi:hypothetical protein [Paenibacillus psychroresistens]|uniref:hypothetical protein n=1 Tax=Paenibacillus psychroresistens TaxID=1778678 RepID=UPI0012DA4160|nr:hypothetical protein [Paenibacillus psychroresistens]